jgi:hypothetical protein
VFGGGARPVEIDHDLKIIRRETIAQAPRTNHVICGDLRTRAVVWAVIRQDHSHFVEPFQQVKAVRITS